MPCSASARSIPTSLDPSTPPPPRTYAVSSSRGIPANLGRRPAWCARVRSPVASPHERRGDLRPRPHPAPGRHRAAALAGDVRPRGRHPQAARRAACSTACSTSSARRCRRSSSPARRRCSPRAATAPPSTPPRRPPPSRSRPSSTRSRSPSSSSTTRPAAPSCSRRRRRTTSSSRSPTSWASTTSSPRATRSTRTAGSTARSPGNFVWSRGKLAAVKEWAEPRGRRPRRELRVLRLDLRPAAAVGRGQPGRGQPRPAARPLRGRPRLADRALRRLAGRAQGAGARRRAAAAALPRQPAGARGPTPASTSRGTEHIPRTGPAILVGNHRSYFDIPAMIQMMRRTGRTGRILAKRELFDVPVVGALATALGGIPVDRASGGPSRSSTPPSALEGGELVCLLPQGTIPRGEKFFDPVLKGRTGAARLAAMTGAPVIPFGVWGTEKVWPRSEPVPRMLNLTAPADRAGAGRPARSSSSCAPRPPTPAGSWRRSPTACRPRPASTGSPPTRRSGSPPRRDVSARRRPFRGADRDLTSSPRLGFPKSGKPYLSGREPRDVRQQRPHRAAGGPRGGARRRHPARVPHEDQPHLGHPLRLARRGHRDRAVGRARAPPSPTAPGSCPSRPRS